jgi:hypothetical protein
MKGAVYISVKNYFAPYISPMSRYKEVARGELTTGSFAFSE